MNCTVGTFAALAGTSHQRPRNTFWIDELEKRWQVAVICVAQGVVASSAGGPKGPPTAASAPTLLMLDAVQRCWRRPAQAAPLTAKRWPTRRDGVQRRRRLCRLIR
ncbi:hypothetical protein JIQ42_05867 [Leishmania sp. Namibia]|uniref:hypothetical protein n=1 Tax=Leishmania sp. Namibia TaxID=2802991 RepID=UPI001B50EA6C|nr:hypothetical protein JIQ42_05867 [Leishmania sp. Namibia]